MSYLSRVAQADATKLDNEIIQILKKQIFEVTKYLPISLTIQYDPELTLLLRLFLFKYTVFKNHATVGQQLLAIKYNNLTPKKLCLYALLTHGLNYLKERVHSMKRSHIRSFNLTKLIDQIDGFILLASYVNFLIFLKNGKKPLLVDRLLDLEQVTTVKRYMNNNIYMFMNREILWHTFIELLIIMIPLINYHSIVRRIRSFSSWLDNSKNEVDEVKRVFDLSTKCPHCKESPILPFHMNCSHIFCYYCLKGNIEADLDYQCPECGFSGKECIKFVM